MVRESVPYNRWLDDDVIDIRTRWLDKGETVNSTIDIRTRWFDKGKGET